MNVQITSDVKNKLKKIIKGIVYNDPTVFIMEAFQNSHRAEAKNINITLEDNHLIIEDDGCGILTPRDILKLDYSNWKTTDEGFGIGFWSWLALDIDNKDITCEIQSNTLNITMSKNEILKTANPSATITELDTAFDGFRVKLVSNSFYNPDIRDNIISKIENDGSYLDENIIFNGTQIKKNDLLDSFIGILSCKVKHKNFTGKFSVVEDIGLDYIDLYYENRKVDRTYSNAGINGILLLNKNTLNLKEPDRTGFVYDNKYFKLKNDLKEIAKEMYLYVLKNYHTEFITDFSDNIDRLFTPREYINLLKVEDLKVVDNSVVNSNTAEENNNNLTEKETIEINQIEDKKDIKVENTVEEKEDTFEEINKEEYSKDNIRVTSSLGYERKTFEDDKEEDNHRTIDENEIIMKAIDDVDGNLNQYLNDNKGIFWVRAKEQKSLSDFIQKAKYYNIDIVEAPNILFEKAFQYKKIPHISEIDNCIEKTNVIKNIKIRNVKEEKIIQLLQKVCDYYKLSKDTFLIADLILKTKLKINGKLITSEKIENTDGDIQIYGLADEKHIYLDRKALQLDRIDTVNPKIIGKNDYKIIIRMIPVLAHELSHLLYNTSDNTLEHYKVQEKLTVELCDIFLNI